MMTTTISPAGTTMTCSVCELSGGPFQVDEAAIHAATHNRVHHRGAPVAIVTTSVSRQE